jgi:CRISPR system Cascade subunit CasA
MATRRPATPAPAPPTAAPPRYDLLTEPWVPCVAPDGRPEAVGLLDALLRAHELREVRDASPLVTYGLYRLLLAVAQDLFAPRGKAEWLALFRRGRFDQQPLRRFRDEYADRFDLFHPTRPFYQSSDIRLGQHEEARGEQKAVTVGTLRPEIPTGTFKNHFHHAYDGGHAYCPACAARSLVVLPPFAWAQGKGYVNSINGSPPVYVWLAGRNLFETLCWNLVLPHHRPKAAAESDRPWWRGDGLVRKAQIKHTVGYLESLTWQPRHVRLIPDLSGSCTFCGEGSPTLVRGIVWAGGWTRPKDAAWWQDPFVAYTGPGERQPAAVRLKEDRPLWRDYAALCLPGSGAGSHQPARITEQAADLEMRLGPDGAPPTLQCYALRNDNADVIEWRRDGLPFSARVASDPGRAAAVTGALGQAGEADTLLKNHIKKLYPREGKGNRKAFGALIRQARDGYWSALAEPFRRLVVALDAEDLEEPGRDALAGGWLEAVRRAARSSFDAVADALDADAESLKRAATARRLLYGSLKRRLP